MISAWASLSRCSGRDHADGFANVAQDARESCPISVTAGLSEAERTQLHELLARVAERRGLIPGVHPGYRDFGH